jgi:hypothetical protein
LQVLAHANGVSRESPAAQTNSLVDYTTENTDKKVNAEGEIATKENNRIREQRKGQYLVSKSEYAAAIRREKSKS